MIEFFKIFTIFRLMKIKKLIIHVYSEKLSIDLTSKWSSLSELTFAKLKYAALNDIKNMLLQYKLLNIFRTIFISNAFKMKFNRICKEIKSTTVSTMKISLHGNAFSYTFVFKIFTFSSQLHSYTTHVNIYHFIFIYIRISFFF